MLTITSQSHLDHNLTLDHVRFLLAHFAERTEFFAETVELPAELPALPCALRGPVVGLHPVPDTLVELRPRPGRSYPSRMLRPYGVTETMAGTSQIPWLPLQSRQLTVIAGPGLGLPCVLYTAFGGPLAPREPADPSLPESEREASARFWAEHALVQE
jgi:hypothetical protein